ncbi:MAG TPA: E3 binding domain-containing protein, partial [Spirochaetia bacterium]|nr:E3 binding domain-containing protein [Spirochaetia bacterium]
MAEKVMMTALSPTMEEGTIVSWNKKEGDTISSGDLLCEVETDKATMDYESTQEGILLKIIRGEGSSSRVGDTIAILGEEGEDVSDLVKEAESAAPAGGDEAAQAADAQPAATTPAGAGTGAGAATVTPAAAAPAGAVKSSPLARKIASERGIDIAQVSGTGPGGRVVKADVENFAPGSAAPGASAPAASAGGFTAVAAMAP